MTADFPYNDRLTLVAGPFSAVYAALAAVSRLTSRNPATF